MNVIIVGYGKIGFTIAKNLAAEKDIDVTVVDNNPNVFEDSAKLPDAIFITGNGVNEKILIEAGAETADLIVCTTNADELNVLCCIMAERLGTQHSMARVRNPEYMLRYNRLWQDLGIDVILNPERKTAREISRLLRYPNADCVDTFVGGRVELVSLKISEAPDFFVGKSISQIFSKKMEMLLAVIERDGEALIPHGDIVFEENDVIRILGRPSSVTDFFSRIGLRSKKTKEVMIIGGGKITHYLAKLLNQHTMKTNIKIIEKNLSKCESLDKTLSELNRHCLIIHGDGTDVNLLANEDIGNMDALISLTDRDEENAMISLYALRMGVKKVIPKMNHINQNMFKDLGLRNIITPQNITADTVNRYIQGLTGNIGGSIRARYAIFESDGNIVEGIEFNANKKAKYIDVPLKDLKLRKGILIGCIIRDFDIIIPSGETRIQMGDSVIVIAKNNANVSEINDILTNKTEG